MNTITHEGCLVMDTCPESDGGPRAAVLVSPWLTPKGRETDREPTRAEARILDYVARGKSNKEIAWSLDIAVSTVKRHLYNAYPKIGAHNRVQAAIIWRSRSELREVA